MLRDALIAIGGVLLLTLGWVATTRFTGSESTVGCGHGECGSCDLPEKRDCRESGPTSEKES